MSKDSPSENENEKAEAERQPVSLCRFEELAERENRARENAPRPAKARAPLPRKS